MITRRLFNQLLAAATSCTALPRRLFGRGSGGTEGLGAPSVSSAPHGSHVDICYVYNPGQDIAGIQQLMFGTLNVIKGGAVTRIDTAKESIKHGVLVDSRYVEFQSREKYDGGVFFGEKRIAKSPLFYEEEVVASRYAAWTRFNESNGEFEDLDTPIIIERKEKRDVIMHPASEILHAFSWDRAYNSLVHIKEWDGKQVDLKGVNEMIAGKTLKERTRALRALPTAWRMTSPLRPRALESIRIFEINRREHLLRAIAGTLTIDTWQRESAALLQIDLKRLYMEKQLAEEAWDATHPESSRPSVFGDRKTFEEYQKEYEGQIRTRLQAFITERYPLEAY